MREQSWMTDCQQIPHDREGFVDNRCLADGRVFTQKPLVREVFCFILTMSVDAPNNPVRSGRSGSFAGRFNAA